MDEYKVKDKILSAAVEILKQTRDASKITARQIAAKAQVNLAMINYYFDSKDALISLAVSSVIKENADTMRSAEKKSGSPKENLRDFLVNLSDITVQFAGLTRPSIPYILLEGELEHPYYILPFIREYFGDSKSELECRMIAYQLVTSFQLIFYRSDDMFKYLGVDILNKEERDKLLDAALDLYFSDKRS